MKYQVNMKLKHQYMDNFYVKKWFLSLILLWLPMMLTAQGLKVKEMKPVLSDLSASVHQRQDSQGNPCGLVKVLIDNPNMGFGDNVVGEVDNRMNEYWVYLPKGTKKLIIRRSDYLPMSILFCDYGIDEIEAKVTYQLVLKETSVNVEKNSLVVNIKPKNASLIIDGYKIDSNPDGSYRLIMEKGEHACRISAFGYRSALEVVNTGRGIQNLNIELESLMAHLIVNCGTTDADIYANDKKIGSGSWKGDIPAGLYTIEARKEGYTPKSVSVYLSDKESKSIVLPSLERNKIPILIRTAPTKCYSRKIMIDGKLVGSDSLCYFNIASGKHIIEINISGCMTIKESVNITKPDTLEFQLAPQNELFASAFDGDYKACFELGGNYANDYKYPDMNQGKYWYDIVLENIDVIDAEWMVNNGRKPYEKLISFYEKINEIEAIRDILNRLELILNSSHPDWFYLCELDLAKAYQRIRDFKQSITWYNKWIPKAKSMNIYYHSSAYMDLGRCYKEMGDLDNALLCFKKAHGIYANYYDDIASVYYEKGDITNAIVWYNKYYRAVGYDKSNGGFHKVEFLKEMKKKGLYESIRK